MDQKKRRIEYRFGRVRSLVPLFVAAGFIGRLFVTAGFLITCLPAFATGTSAAPSGKKRAKHRGRHCAAVRGYLKHGEGVISVATVALGDLANEIGKKRA